MPSSDTVTAAHIQTLAHEQRWDELLVAVAVAIARQPRIVTGLTATEQEALYRLLLLSRAEELVIH